MCHIWAASLVPGLCQEMLGQCPAGLQSCGRGLVVELRRGTGQMVPKFCPSMGCMRPSDVNRTFQSVKGRALAPIRQGVLASGGSDLLHRATWPNTSPERAHRQRGADSTDLQAGENLPTSQTGQVVPRAARNKNTLEVCARFPNVPVAAAAIILMGAGSSSEPRWEV